MILFSLIITILSFIRYFIEIGQSRMSIFPIGILVSLFFASGIQANQKNGLKEYFDGNLQTLSRILINSSFLIILSLYSLSRPLASIILISLNGFLLAITYIIDNNSRVASYKSSIYFLSIIYICWSLYRANITWEWFSLISLWGWLLCLLTAFRSSYIFLLRLSSDKKHKLIYEAFLLYHYLFIVLCVKLYYNNPFLWYIIIQIYISIVIYITYRIKNAAASLHTSVIDLDVEYILRGYRMNQIPTSWESTSRIIHPSIQKFVQHIPMTIYTSLSISSIITTIAFCITIIYYWNTYSLNLQDFIYFLINTILYIIWFYYAKKIGIADNMWRFFGFIATNICYYIVVAQVFGNDTISVLFRSFLRAAANNLAMNTMQDLKSYLGKSDYQYRLMSNFFGLLIIIYFFMTLSLDILVKVAFVVMIVWLWLLMNKDNLKEMMERKA